VADEAVKLTELPWQIVVEPPAVTVGVGKLLITTATVAVAVPQALLVVKV
jgi:hypothetical protein